MSGVFRVFKASAAAVYGLTIFISSFLLFQIQPLIAKYILPWFGGGPGVWTTCMLFFQVALLAGYCYAHLSSSRLPPRSQAAIHLLLVFAALMLLPIIPAESWKPRGPENPTWRIVGLLTWSLGLPYLVLSATGPLLQHWFSRAYPAASPYRLFALSNVASLLALVTFPFYFETHFARKTQAVIWGGGLAAYAVACGYCALRTWQDSSGRKDQSRVEPSKAGPGFRGLWLLLPACASMLLLATTNKICQDVAVVPFLWVLPLALYLLSFIICFDNPRWYVRAAFGLGLAGALAAVCWVLFHGGTVSLGRQVGIYCLGLFMGCMVCHGELYRLRPDPGRLTRFYLAIAAGGALGGVAVAVVAPAIFADYYELHCGLLLCALLFLVVCARDRAANGRRQWIWLAVGLPLAGFGGLDWSLGHLARRADSFPGSLLLGLRIGMWVFLGLVVLSWVLRKKYRDFRHWQFLACVWLALGVVTLGATLSIQAKSRGHEQIDAARNFYGVLRLYEHRKSEPEAHHLLLQHGRITHGLQFVEVDRSRWPTTYYSQESGIGLAVDALPKRPRKIGLVGLGAGTLLAYARLEDDFRIYEINPEVRRIATSRFTYFSNAAGGRTIVLGDARLSLEREAPQGFDLLALDAFSGDAIPVHLLTVEAFAVYERHMKSNGIIAVHISNHYLDLQPVLLNVARHFNYRFACVDYDENDDTWWAYGSTWFLLSRDRSLLDSPAIRNAATASVTNAVTLPLWTDDFTALFPILR